MHSINVSQAPLTLCGSMDCSPPGSSVHGSLQARILEWVTISVSGGSSRFRNRTHISCIAGGFFTAESLWKPLLPHGGFQTWTGTGVPLSLGPQSNPAKHIGELGPEGEGEGEGCLVQSEGHSRVSFLLCPPGHPKPGCAGQLALWRGGQDSIMLQLCK